MATEEKTTDVAQTQVFRGPSDSARARGTVGGYATDETPEAMPQTQRSASCLCTSRLGWYQRLFQSHRGTPRDFGRSSVTRRCCPISISARHGTDVKADKLDKDLMEYAVKPVRPVSLCTDKTSYRFGLMKVELKKENIEKNTPVLSISGRITLHIIVNFFGNETEIEPLFCTARGYRATSRNELLFPSHFCVRGEVSCGQKQISPGHVPGCIPGNVADPSSSSEQQKLRVRRQHLRVRERLHLRVCH